MAFSYPINRKHTADARISTFVEPNGSATEKIRALESYYFYYNQTAQDMGYGRFGEDEFYATQPRKIGLIAQELQAVEPSLIFNLDMVGQDIQYYGIDYQALNVLILDALNELNSRADAIKTQLSMPVETYPERTYTPEVISNQITLDGINVNPVNGEEGTIVTWSIVGNNLPPQTVLFFKLTGTFNYLDIEHVSQGEGDQSELKIWSDDAGVPAEARTELGDAFGRFVTDENGNASISMKYVKDALVEGDETITMTIDPENLLGGILNTVSATATITDS